MSLATNLTNFVNRASTEFRAIRSMITGSSTGNLSGLNGGYTNLIAAINAASEAGGAASLNELSDVTLTAPAEFDLLRLNGAGQFVNIAGSTYVLAADIAEIALSGDAGDLTGTLPSAVLPPLAITDVHVVASQAAMLALSAQRGDIAKRTDTSRTYILSTDDPTTLADWIEVHASGDVLSVAGRTGAVVLTKADVGLSNADNTSDANKPISTATQAALDVKQAAHANLTGLSNVVLAADTFVYATGPGTFALATVTGAARTLLDDATVADMRETLSVYSKAEIGDPETNFVEQFETALNA